MLLKEARRLAGHLRRAAKRLRRLDAKVACPEAHLRIIDLRSSMIVMDNVLAAIVP